MYSYLLTNYERMSKIIMSSNMSFYVIYKFKYNIVYAYENSNET